MTLGNVHRIMIASQQTKYQCPSYPSKCTCPLKWLYYIICTPVVNMSKNTGTWLQSIYIFNLQVVKRHKIFVAIPAKDPEMEEAEAEVTWKRETIPKVLKIVSMRLPQRDLISLLLVSPWLHRTLVSHPSLWLVILSSFSFGMNNDIGL